MNRYWICQTFWTKPMQREKLATNLELARISLYYAKRSGYLVRMHTDSEGYKLLRAFGYDELVKTLDDIPESIPTKFFAYSKYIALKREGLGVVHTDFDVFLKSNCLDDFYTDPNIDCILQNVETDTTHNGYYTKARQWFRNDPLYDFLYKHTLVSNVGVIGFNSAVLKGMYLEEYERCVAYYTSRAENMHFVPDLFFEQVAINYLVCKYKFNAYYILTPGKPFGDETFDLEADNSGYQHVLGPWKHTPNGKWFIHRFYKKLFAGDPYLIWASPCSGKTNLCESNDKYVDFDIVKEKYGLSREGLSQEDPEYTPKLCKLFWSTWVNNRGKGKIILFSDHELLRYFFPFFDKVYYLDKDDMKKRVITRGRDFVNDKFNLERWFTELDNTVKDIQPYKDTEHLVGYLSDIYK